MKKIRIEEFQKECKKLQGETVWIEIGEIITTKKKIKNAQIVVNSNRILISNDNQNEININANYISNFYIENEKIICELDNIAEIYIYAQKKS